MQFRASDLAARLGGRLVGPDVEVSGVAFDSRSCPPGSLFVPLVAERDGHDFVPDAVAAGAVAYLTSRGPLAAEATAIEVADTAAALLDVGREARRRLPDRVVAVTGSVGKSSVKDLTAAVLRMRWPTAASPQSFNNEIGVPTTLANAEESTQAAVIEMGARGIGHIRLLCDVAAPNVGVVTRVAAVHTAFFGTIEDVARGKGELIESLPESGAAVLNAADPRVARMRSLTRARCVTFSGSGPEEGPGPADLRAERIELDADLRPSFVLVSPWGSAPARLAVSGRHNVGNALAAAAAGMVLGLGLEEVLEGLATASLSPSRMAVATAPSGLRVLNDAYNANPTSMAAALEALAGLGTGRRVAVVGVMAELDESESAAEHRRMAGLAADLGVEVVAVDTHEYGPAPVAGIAGALAALEAMDPPLGKGDAVLVKASRVAGLERVAAALLNGD